MRVAYGAIRHRSNTTPDSQFAHIGTYIMMTYYLNGEFVPASAAALPLNDLGIVRGYGVFDLLRTYHGIPFKLHEHVQRLECSASAIGLTLPASVTQIAEIAGETYRRNALANATIRMIVTGGPSPNLMTPQGNPTLAVMVEPVIPGLLHEYTDGAKLVSVCMERFMPTVKSLNYIGAIMAMQAAARSGAVEALYRNRAGLVSECTRSNLFALAGNQLLTPQDDVLAGITRAVVMEIARDEYQVIERSLSYTDLLACDEVFITSSTKEILPIVEIDGHPIGHGRPGARTQKLMRLFAAYVAQYR
jgi:branched-chain amino acid aminotransferase